MGRVTQGLLASLLVACSAAAAQGQTQRQDFSVSELRGGLFFHSVDEASRPGATIAFLNAGRLEDVNLEVLFNASALNNGSLWGTFRPHIGTTMNFGGLESMVYGGISWTIPIASTPLFVEASFGGAAHNGATRPMPGPGRNLGCSVLFRESASLGWRLAENWSVMATVEHASNAGLCGPNRGLTNLGFRVGYSF